MTDYTDGSSFVGLENTVITADEVVDTWLDHRIWSNSNWLGLGKNACSLTFTTHNTSALTTYTGSRPFVGVGGWCSIVAIPFYIDLGLTGFEIAIDYLGYTFGGTNPDTDARVRIEGMGIDGAETTFTLADTTAGGGPEYTDATVTVSFDTPYKGAAGWATLVIEIQSGEGATYDTITPDSGELGQNLGRIKTSANGDVAPGSTLPATNSYELKKIVDGRGGEYMVMGVDTNSTNPEYVYHWPVRFSPYLNADLTFTDVSWVSIRSVSIRPTYSASSLTPVQQIDLAANIPNRGLVAGYHAEAIRRYSTRRRLIAMGPPGVVYSDNETWPDNYANIWSFQTASGSNQMDSLVDVTTMITRENPRIVVAMLCVGTTFTGQALTSSSWRDRGLVDWDFTLRVRQLQDGDSTWAGASFSQSQTNTDPTTIATYPINDACRMLWAMGLLTDQGDFSSATPSTYTFAYTDGQLTGNDYEYLQPVFLEIDLSSFTTIQNQPVRIDVTAALDTITASPANGYTTAELQARTRLWCVGYSVWEYSYSG